MNDEDFERLLRPYLAAQSLAALRPHFARWPGFLRQHGITRLPTSPWSNDREEARAIDFVSLLARQCFPRRDKKTEHILRDVLGVRPYKG
jgi:hypothetical protein